MSEDLQRILDQLLGGSKQDAPAQPEPEPLPPLEPVENLLDGWEKGLPTQYCEILKEPPNRGGGYFCVTHNRPTTRESWRRRLCEEAWKPPPPTAEDKAVGKVDRAISSARQWLREEGQQHANSQADKES